MKDDGRIDRREFMQRGALGGAALGLAATSAAHLPAADRTAVAMIGAGARAHQLMEAIKSQGDAQIVGVCDAYKGRIQRSLERLGNGTRIYKDYREALADKSVDAVVIGTPDHWHATMAIEAMRAGKDVYIEKPLTYTIAEGLAIVEEVRRSGRILQAGSQGMSSPTQRKAREIIESGKLGRVTIIRAFFNRNTAGGAWIYPIPPDASPATVDWEMFQGPAPKHPVDYARFFRWRCYKDYSGGIATDLFVHLVTSIHFMMKAKMPSQVVAMGQLYRWKESRDVPDTINAILEYPEGFVVNLSSTFNNQMSNEAGFQILGTEGSLILGNGLTFMPERVNEDNRWVLDSWPTAMEAAFYADPKNLREEVPLTREPVLAGGQESYQEVGMESTYLHFRSFFEAVRSRRQPAQDALAGHRAAACAHLINLSAREKRMVSWDFARDNLKTS